MNDLEKISLRSVDWTVRFEDDLAVFTADGVEYRFDDMSSIGRRWYLILDGDAVVAVDPIGTTRASNAPLLVHTRTRLQYLSEGA